MKKHKNTGVVSTTPSAKDIYESIKSELAESDTMSAGDHHLLMLYAINLDLYNQKLMEVAACGGVQEFPNGTKQVSPDYTIMRNCLSDIMKLSTMLGFNTAARARLKIPESVHITDPLNDVG
jgi:P27 family predicted phage terminase small subunit